MSSELAPEEGSASEPMPFAIDLLGPLDACRAVASHPIDLPGGREAFRHWQVTGRSGSTAVGLNLSFAPGQAGTVGSASSSY